MYEGRADLEPGTVIGHDPRGEVVELGAGVDRINARRHGLPALQRGLRLVPQLRAGLDRRLTHGQPGDRGRRLRLRRRGPLPRRSGRRPAGALRRLQLPAPAGRGRPREGERLRHAGRWRRSATAVRSPTRTRRPTGPRRATRARRSCRCRAWRSIPPIACGSSTPACRCSSRPSPEGPKLVGVDLVTDRVVQTIVVPPNVALPHLVPQRRALRPATGRRRQGLRHRLLRRRAGRRRHRPRQDERRAAGDLRAGGGGAAPGRSGLGTAQRVGRRLAGGAGDGMESDAVGRVYATDYEHNAILPRDDH